MTMRSRLADGETLIGTLHDVTDPVVIEIMGQIGYDYVVLEYEHGLRNLETIQHLIRATESAGICVLVRIGTVDSNLISRILEAGATGVMVAHIKTPEEARTIVEAAHYPPEGTRGQGYVRRRELWRLGEAGAEADRRSNREAVILALIEDLEGVDNIEAILDTPGLTGVAPGIADLAASMGNLPFDHPDVDDAMKKVRSAVAARPDRVLQGLVVEPQQARVLAEAGTQLLLLNHDVLIIAELYEQWLTKAREVLNE